MTLRLYPGETLGFQVALDFVDGHLPIEEGPAMRELMLSGAALSIIDPRLPRLVASTFDENMNLERLKSLINSLVPGAFNSAELNSAVLAALSAHRGAPAVVEDKEKPHVTQPVEKPKNVKSEEELLRDETSRISNAMVGADADLLT